ncbi:uncharacterized protein HMPREF1541_10804 [Cyphellophora europaea CBS 101466]|uniref:Probable E3 ubiquitin ligase complex SCF subunit sconB n=1 Tax=Cyphellophora europaea (strain CBS 101466) TaxID=1220924 RepID=W2S869_CYPE1|nr:uncharacterized protein HMPREF1541_10804 [Cyphellophora europaea CBS 101466]ETN44253.1 hypothetical protein HMPREF1541_10804 [Cyphellophora europaea CBS 101466]
MKRRLSETADPGHERRHSGHAGKRQRVGYRRALLELPEELLSRIFAFLDVRQLIALELVSHRLRYLSTDSELWKQQFYRQWIEPRARRIPIDLRPNPAKLVRWLEHGESLKHGAKVDWKRQFRLRNNWEKGEAHLQEVEVAHPLTPPVLAKVNKGQIFTADAASGLRVWSQTRKVKKLEAHVELHNVRPTSLAVDGSSTEAKIAIGFENGHCEIYQFKNSTLKAYFNYTVSPGSMLTSMALAMPYLVAMTSDRHIHLYQLTENDPNRSLSASTMAVLHADSPLHPATLSLRCTQKSVIATIAYAFNRINEGWCLGIQEIKLSREDGVMESRTASNIETPLDARYRGRKQWDISSRSAFSTPLTLPFSLNPDIKSPPTSLSYSHPFLLASLSDNTIMSYIVQSDEEKLEVSSGRRLFGHTSAITSAEVSNRGKAVSVSARGDEIRVWELEQMLTTVRGRASTQVKPRNGALSVAAALALRGNGLGLVLQEMKRELAMTRRWVSFDEEQVVVLGERDERQIMACYDFA